MCVFCAGGSADVTQHHQQHYQHIHHHHHQQKTQSVLLYFALCSVLTTLQFTFFEYICSIGESAGAGGFCLCVSVCVLTREVIAARYNTNTQRQSQSEQLLQQ